jgi:hypothetical protein
MPRYRSGYISIDISEVLDEIEDNVLLTELHSRKLSPAEPGETVDLDIVREAYEALGRNNVIEARAVLDRLLFPKWKSRRSSQSAYDFFRKSTVERDNTAARVNQE